MRGCACRGTAGFVHVSCLAEQAKILYAEAEENNLGLKVLDERFARWHTCGLCEQQHHGVVKLALGWACWKTYVGRPEEHQLWGLAMNFLGMGLFDTNHNMEALSVQEAELSMRRRIGAPEESMLATQSNLASTYQLLGRLEDALRMRQDAYSVYLKLNGAEYEDTLVAAYNYALSLFDLQRFKEARSLLRSTMPVARRALKKSDDLTLRMRWIHARTLYMDPSATLDDVREAVTTLEDTERTARRVLGGAHPTAMDIEHGLREARAVLAAREAGRTVVVDIGS